MKLKEKPVKIRTVVEAVKCSLCKRFCGVITSDGKGPIFDECPDEPLKRLHDSEIDSLLFLGKRTEAAALAGNRSAECPMIEKLKPYLRPLTVRAPNSSRGHPRRGKLAVSPLVVKPSEFQK